MSFVYGPTFAEMLDPSKVRPDLRDDIVAARRKDPLDPLNLYHITWKPNGTQVSHLVFPSLLTGVAANIVVLVGNTFPTGALKVGPAYSTLMEKQLNGLAVPGKHTCVFPSTGNFGIGGSWVGPRMGYKSLVVLPEEMSAERFEKIRGYGADVIATPGCESNVKEIYDKVNELHKNPENVILNQFAEFGNYRFHYHVTGNSALELCQKIGNGRIAAFVSAMGSAGTIAAADRIKQVCSESMTVGLEPIQCPTLYNVGFGGHRIEGIGDKHVTWIHNVMNMDLLICIDDLATLRGLQLIQEGRGFLESAFPGVSFECLVGTFGMSGICNLLGAIKTAKYLNLKAGENVVTLATDGFDRYPSVLHKLNEEGGPMNRDEAMRRIELFLGANTDHIQEGSRATRQRWHNQKYFTWVEQQGKGVGELNALADQSTWVAEQAKIADLDARWKEARGF
jgi:cysteine synthase